MSEPAPFDLEHLQQLFELMAKNGVTDVSLRHGGDHWRVRRGSPMTAVQMAPMAVAPPVAAPPVAAPSAPAAAPSTAAPKDDGLLTVKAPTVGTFYSQQSPEDPPFVTVGSKISPQTTVCLIEAMKVFNPIPAEVSGTVEAILVKNGDAVEFGQPLFKVRP